MVFKEYERSVLNLLLSDVYSIEEIARILEESEFVDYEYTGSGYFLGVRHPMLPDQRTVCHLPLVIGEADDIVCGFVIFLENKELTLECHSWGEKEVTEDFRNKDVRVTAVRLESGKFIPLSY